VARSLEVRNGFTAEKSGALWLSHVTSALRWTTDRPRILTFYEDIMKDCESELLRLAAFLELSGRLEPRLLKEAQAFVDETLYHHRPCPGGTGKLSLGHPVESLYRELRTTFSEGAATTDSEPAPESRRSPARRDELAGTRPQLQPAAFEVKALRNRIRAADAELTSVAAERAAMHDEMARQRHSRQEERVQHEAAAAEFHGHLLEEIERRLQLEKRFEQIASRVESAKTGTRHARARLRTMRAGAGFEGGGLLSAIARVASRWSATADALGLSSLPTRPGTYKCLLLLLVRPHHLRDAYLTAASGLLDEAYYRGRYPDVAASRMRALMHFVLHGSSEGRHPHPFFDTTWYLSTAPDVASRRANPLMHFLKYGHLEKCDPHPFFSPEFYLAALGQTRPVWDNALVDYAMFGSQECLSPHPLFDPEYYLESNPDVASSGLHPLSHFMECGALEGRNPHPLFDVLFYLNNNRDVAASGVNPLQHYRYCGAFESRNPHPLFDVSYYLQTNPDVRRAKLDPLTHFLTVGAAQGCNPNPSFDCEYYASQVPEVAAGQVNPLVHFVRQGWQLGLNPSRDFDMTSYIEDHDDVRRWAGNPLVHYLNYGHLEGRKIRKVAERRSDAAGIPGSIGGAFPASAARMSAAREAGAPSRVCRRFALYTSSLGNYFFGEIRDLLAAGLEDLGFFVEKRDERQGFGDEADWHIVVAPHEFFYLGCGPDLLRNGAPRQLVLLNTEQPSTPWFSLALACFSHAHAVWDISFESARLIGARGYRCSYLALGYSSRFEGAQEIPTLPHHYGTAFLEPEVRHWSASRRPRANRPIDVLFVGHISLRREQFFAKAAPILARHRCYLHFSSVTAPVIPGRTTHMDTATVMGLAQRSKILLNIHHGADCYFEWHRIVIEGIWQQTLVVTEPCGPAPPFKPGVDFIEVPLDDVPSAIDDLLSTPHGRAESERIVETAFRTLVEECRLADSLRELILDLHNVPDFPGGFRQGAERRHASAASAPDRQDSGQREPAWLAASSPDSVRMSDE